MKFSVSRRAQFVLLAAVFAALARWSWLKWPDLLIDFGTELYLPWRLSLGQTLYLDLAWKHGPLSPYFNALLFSLFGVSLKTLVWANLALLAALVLLLHRYFRDAAGELLATACCLFFLCVFAFSQYTGTGNYNYICPYSHTQTHGLLLGVAMLQALVFYSRKKRPLLWLAAAGACLGGVLLTKIELSAAAGAAAAAGLALLLRAEKPAGKARALTVFSAGALLPPALFLILLAARMPFSTALKGLAGDFLHIGSGTFAHQFYLVGMGLYDPGKSLAALLKVSLGLALCLAAAAGLDHALRRVQRSSALGALLGAGVFILLALSPGAVAWPQIGKPLPLAALAAAAVFGRRCLKRLDASDFAFFIWSVFSFVLLWKMALDARIAHYGFILAMPAALLSAACLLGPLPEELRRRWGNGAVFRGLMGGLLCACVFFHLRWSQGVYALKTLPVGRGADLFYTYRGDFQDAGPIVNAALEHLPAILPPAATLLALPEGLMLNYQLRRANPTPQLALTPQDFEDFGGEAAVLAQLKKSPPDFIALVQRDVSEFGAGNFGQSPAYGKLTLGWVQADYRKAALFGAEPGFKDFGILLYRRGSSAGRGGAQGLE